MADPLDPLDPTTTALVVVDLQKVVVAMSTVPHSPDEIVARSASLARRFREVGGLVVAVRASGGIDNAVLLRPPADRSMGVPKPMEGREELALELNVGPGDVIITKYNWGAFHGTDLELQLRRRGIATIVLTGIATNYGVESTARQAFERGFSQIFVEDSMGAFTVEEHEMSLTRTMPAIGRVRNTEAVLTALGARVAI